MTDEPSRYGLGADDEREAEPPRYVPWKGVCGHSWMVANLDWSQRKSPECPDCAARHSGWEPLSDWQEMAMKEDVSPAAIVLSEAEPLYEECLATWGNAPDDLSESEPISITDEKGRERNYHAVARLVLDDLCDDPAVWATHGMPDESKMNRIENRICEAFRAMASVASRDDPWKREHDICMQQRDAALARAEAAEAKFEAEFDEPHVERADRLQQMWYLAVKRCEELSSDRDAWSAQCAELVTENGRLRGALAKAEERAVDRVGPADEVHERVHRVVGDILSGKVTNDARRQLQESLKVAPKDKTPFPVNVAPGDRRKMGWPQ